MLQVGTADLHTNYMRASDATYLDGRQHGTLTFVLTPTHMSANGFVRLGGNGTVSATKGWAIHSDNNSVKRIYVNLNTSGGSTNVGNNSAVGNLANGTQYHIAIVFDLTTSPGNIVCSLYVNGVLSDSQTTTGLTNGVGRPFQWGYDPQGYLSTGFKIGEEEWSATAMTQAQVTAAYNAGRIQRQQDIGITVSNYHHLFTMDATGPIDDSVGSVSYTLSGITTPQANYVDHPNMAVGLIYDLQEDCYADGAKTIAVPGDLVYSIPDQSGRGITITQTDSAKQATLGEAPDGTRYLIFQSFNYVSYANTPMYYDGPSNLRFNTRAFTLYTVASCHNHQLTNQAAAFNTSFKTLFMLDGGNGTTTGDLTRTHLGSISSTALAETGTIRMNGDFGSNEATRLYCPTSPMVYGFVGGASARTAYVGNGTGIHTATAAAFSVNDASTGSFRIGGRTNTTSHDYHGFWGRIYRMEILFGDDSANRATKMASLASSYSIPQTPGLLVFLLGSSSMAGTASENDRAIAPRLWDDTQALRSRNAWVFNVATSGSMIGAASGIANDSDEAVAHTILPIIAQHPAVPVLAIDWNGINNVSADPGSEETPEDLLALRKAQLTSIRNAAIAAGSTYKGIMAGYLPSGDYDTDDNVQRHAINALLLTDSDFGTLWSGVVMHHTDPVFAGSDTPDLTYYLNEISDKHLINAGFDKSIPYWFSAMGKVFGGGGARRCRARCRCRATAA